MVVVDHNVPTPEIHLFSAVHGNLSRPQLMHRCTKAPANRCISVPEHLVLLRLSSEREPPVRCAESALHGYLDEQLVRCDEVDPRLLRLNIHGPTIGLVAGHQTDRSPAPTPPTMHRSIKLGTPRSLPAKQPENFEKDFTVNGRPAYRSSTPIGLNGNCTLQPV